MQKNSGLFYSYLRKFSFPKRCFLWYCLYMRYLINFSILSQSVSIFHVSLSNIYHYLNIWKDLLFFNETKNLLIKKGLVVETSLDLIYMLPYDFYLVHVIYYFYLFFSCRQPWYQPLVNTSLISPFLENVSNFNFLANALYLTLLHLQLESLNA